MVSRDGHDLEVDCQDEAHRQQVPEGEVGGGEGGVGGRERGEASAELCVSGRKTIAGLKLQKLFSSAPFLNAMGGARMAAGGMARRAERSQAEERKKTALRTEMNELYLRKGEGEEKGKNKTAQRGTRNGQI